MTVLNPKPASTNAVEPKVSAATLGAYVAGVLLLVLVQVFTDNDNELLLAVLPDALETFVLPLVPAVVALIAGFAAKHQWRSIPINNDTAGSRGVG